ncbi:MAG: hypothetical protein WCB51_03275 [Candidatus Dormiibacterota bacterium]
MTSTATQSAGPAHDTPPNPIVVTSAACQAAAPLVGCVEVATSPNESTATQRVLEPQETPTNWVTPATLATFQAVEPAAGLVDVTTSPPSSTATHNPVLGQDTLLMELPVKGA